MNIHFILYTIYVLKSFEEFCNFVLVVFDTLLAVWTVVSSAYMSTYVYNDKAKLLNIK